MPVITNILGKIDLEKLSKSTAVKDINILFDVKKTGVLKLNIKYNPPDVNFADNFMEILKLVLSGNEDKKVNFKEI